MRARAARGGGPTVYVLGAGASHEGGVPLASHILPGGLQMLRDLEKLGRSSKKRRLVRAPRATARGDDYLCALGPAHVVSFRRVYDFIARTFQARAGVADLDPETLPTLDELWGVLEIAYRNRATFERGGDPANLARVRNDLMAVLYHVLLGCRISYDSGAKRVSYGETENPYGDFVRALGPRDVVVALNYDTLLDAALRDAGRAIEYGTDVLRAGSAERGRPVTLLKLHGSFDWLWCPSCNTMQAYGGQNVAHIPLEEDSEEARCPVDGAPREYVIIPPSLIKSYDNLHIQRIWDAAAAALRACARVVFVGYSVPESDIYVTYLLKQSTALNPRLARGAPRIRVVNDSDEAQRAYVRLFGRERVESVKMPFGEYLVRAGRRGKVR